MSTTTVTGQQIHDLQVRLGMTDRPFRELLGLSPQAHGKIKSGASAEKTYGGDVAAQYRRLDGDAEGGRLDEMLNEVLDERQDERAKEPAHEVGSRDPTGEEAAAPRTFTVGEDAPAPARTFDLESIGAALAGELPAPGQHQAVAVDARLSDKATGAWLCISWNIDGQPVDDIVRLPQGPVDPSTLDDSTRRQLTQGLQRLNQVAVAKGERLPSPATADEIEDWAIGTRATVIVRHFDDSGVPRASVKRVKPPKQA